MCIVRTYFCVCELKNLKVCSGEVFVYLLAKSIYLHVCGNFDIHEMYRTRECFTFTHFVIVRKVFLLAICPPIFDVVSICTSEVVRVHESESCPAVCQNGRERKLSKAQTIYRLSCHVNGSKFKIYFCKGQKSKCVNVVESTRYVTTLSNQVPETI